MSRFAALGGPRAAGLVVLLTCLAFLNSFAGVFVYDDFSEIERNPHLERLLPPWEAMFQGNLLPARPLPYLTFAIDRAVWGTRPFGYHFLNVAIHATAAVALFALVRLTLRSPRLRGRFGERAEPLAMLVAILWAVHPLQTQAVTYVYQRIESLTGMLALVALACFARAAADRQVAGRWPRGWLAGCLAATAAAMASKENAVVIPVLVLLYDWLFVVPATETFPAAVREIWSRRGFYLLLAATWAILFGLLAALAGEYQEFQVKPHTPLEYALTQPGVILHYLRLAVRPSDQRIDYATWPLAKSPADAWPALAAVATLVIVTAAGLVARRPWAALGGLFFLALAPTSSILPVEAVANEHRMYLALAAVMAGGVLAADAVLEWLRKGRPWWARHGTTVAGAAAGTIILSLLIGTVFRNTHYATRDGVWLDLLIKDPDNYRANWMMATIYEAGGEPEIALKFADRTLSANPRCMVANGLAKDRLQKGDVAGAEDVLRRALAVQRERLPADDRALLGTQADLAIVLRLQGRYAEAAALGRESLEPLRRVLGDGHQATISVAVIVAEADGRDGRHDRADRGARAALAAARRRFGPTHDVTQNAAVALALILRAAGQPAQAEAVVRAALADSRRHWKPLESTAKFEALLGQIQEEVRAARRQQAADDPAPHALP
ncbi:MAG: tetratricopeptide repeat protein [Planctomycetia bacterium]|nr:tetratricopeptide repeat protein [Planctomycetia bacterium]